MTQEAKLQQLAIAFRGMIERLGVGGKMITDMQLSPITEELTVTYTDGTVESFGPVVGSPGKPGIDGVSVVNLKLVTDELKPGEVFFSAELSNGIILQTQESISGYNGKSISNAYIQDNSFIVILDDGSELPPIPVSGLTPVSIVGARIQDGKLFFKLSNNSELDAGVAGDLKGVGIASMELKDGVLSVVYTKGPDKVILGNLRSLEELYVHEGKLKVRYNTTPNGQEEPPLANYMTFTGAKVVGNELILTTSLPAPDNEINLGPVANLKGDKGTGIIGVSLVGNKLVFQTDDNTEIPPVPVSGLTPISVIGARYDPVAEEIVFKLSNDTEIKSGISADFKGAPGADGVSLKSVNLANDGKLYVTLSNAPATPVHIGTVPSVQQLYLENGKLKLKYNTDPDNSIELGSVLGIKSITNVDGVIKVTMTDDTVVDAGNVKSVLTMSVVNGNLQVTYSDKTTATLGSVIGPKGVGVKSTVVNAAGDLVVTLTDGSEMNAGKVRTDTLNFIGNIKNFVTTEGQVEFTVDHANEVIFIAAGDVLPPSSYDTTLADRVTLDAALPAGTAVQIIAFQESGFAVINKGVKNISNTNGLYTITLEDGTSYSIDTNKTIDVTTLPPGIKEAKIVNNRLVLTLSNLQELDVGPTSTSRVVTGAKVVAGKLIISLSDDTEIEAGSVVSNLAVEGVTINQAGNLIITFTGGQTFDAGLAGKYVTAAKIENGHLIISLSDETDLDAGQVISPIVGTPYDFVTFEGQFEFPVQHQGNKVIVFINGACLHQSDLDLTHPNVRVKVPRTAGSEVTIIVLTQGNMIADTLAGASTAPDNTFYGVRQGVPGFHSLNVETLGKPYTRKLAAGQTVLNDIYHNGSVLVFRGDKLLHQGTGFTLPPDNRRVVLTVPGFLDEEITVLVLSEITPMGDFRNTAYANVFYQTNSQGGTFTSGGRRTRQLNGLADNGLGLTVANNRITIQAGLYYVRGWAACQGVRGNALYLYDTVTKQDVIAGPVVFSSVADSPNQVGMNSYTPISGYMFLSTQTALTLMHECVTTKATNGFGAVGSGFDAAAAQGTLGRPSRLVDLEIWRVG
jgi:hypothetical protein